MLFKKINNSGLGLCHVLKENKWGYLIYSEENIQHFIITNEIKEDNSFVFNRYYSDLDKCLDKFNKLGSEYDD